MDSIPTKQASLPQAQNLQSPPVVTDPTKLPGAIFFFTVKPKNDNFGKYSLIAYDPLVNDGDQFSTILTRWQTNGLPYREKFTWPIEATTNPADNIAKLGRGHYYSE